MPSTLLIRADASVSIGTGHIMRMIALGQAWQVQGGEVHFLCAEITSALEERLASEGFQLSRISAVLGSKEDLEQTTHLITDTLQADRQNARVVLDGYHFGADYQHGIKAAGFKLLVVDDYGHADFYHADWVLNQNISAREELYAKRSPDTKLLLGPKFAMLRKEFLAYKGWQREISPLAKKILVTLGGSDPDNVTLKVIQTLIDLGLHAKVVIGGSNPHLREIENFIQSQKDSTALIEVIVNATNMPELMAWADVAVAAAGSTCWELAFMGLPNLVFILADNQVEIAEGLAARQVAVSIGSPSSGALVSFKEKLGQLPASHAERYRISQVSYELVDGSGAKRVLAGMVADSLLLKRVEPGDFKILWEWANDPLVRQASFEAAPISWEEHLKWCNRKITDASCCFYLASFQSGEPVAQVRFDIENQEAIVSIGLASSLRGRGLGLAVLLKATALFFENSNSKKKIHAFIKPTNHASMRVFEVAGFRWLEETQCKSQTAHHYILNKDAHGEV
jgi:UDP-2,4-diacetamido-2,4,6-trideoxy-beta-L-altropyranose hydrolase